MPVKSLHTEKESIVADALDVNETKQGSGFEIEDLCTLRYSRNKYNLLKYTLVWRKASIFSTPSHVGVRECRQAA